MTNTDKQYLVCVGAPFEQQTFYGPFPSFDDADQWCCNLKHSEYTWICSLYPGDSITEEEN